MHIAGHMLQSDFAYHSHKLTYLRRNVREKKVIILYGKIRPAYNETVSPKSLQKADILCSYISVYGKINTANCNFKINNHSYFDF